LRAAVEHLLVVEQRVEPLQLQLLPELVDEVVRPLVHARGLRRPCVLPPRLRQHRASRRGPRRALHQPRRRRHRGALQPPHFRLRYRLLRHLRPGRLLRLVARLARRLPRGRLRPAPAVLLLLAALVVVLADVAGGGRVVVVLGREVAGAEAVEAEGAQALHHGRRARQRGRRRGRSVPVVVVLVLVLVAVAVVVGVVVVAAAVGAGGERDGANDDVEEEEERRRGEVAADQRPRRRHVRGVHLSDRARAAARIGEETGELVRR
uniref:Uncharacterized protein n=1 Tax=Triticum urartu TaxID=4572 RepID=A0A8R7PU46_TRIUA